METNGQKDSVYSNLAKVALEESEEKFRIFMENTQQKKIEKALHRAIKEIESLVEKRRDKEKGARDKSKHKPQSAEDTINI